MALEYPSEYPKDDVDNSLYRFNHIVNAEQQNAEDNEQYD
jgi:hypothetical protein